MIQYRRFLRLDSSSSYISCSHQDKNQHLSCITAHTLWRSHTEHQVNTKSFLVLFTCRVCCHVHVALWFWRGGQILPLLIKRIFSCSFRNKHMHLLTHVYGIFLAMKQDACTISTTVRMTLSDLPSTESGVHKHHTTSTVVEIGL